MKRWQVSVGDLLVLTTLVAVSFFLMRIGSQAAVLGFLPGSYFMAVFRRGAIRRTWSDLFIRMIYCGLGGGVSLIILVITTVGTAKPPSWGPIPGWLLGLLVVVYGATGVGLGAIYGGVETRIRWRKGLIDIGGNGPDEDHSNGACVR